MRDEIPQPDERTDDAVRRPVGPVQMTEDGRLVPVPWGYSMDKFGRLYEEYDRNPYDY